MVYSKEKIKNWGKIYSNTCAYCNEYFEYDFKGRIKEFCGKGACNARRYRANKKAKKKTNTKHANSYIDEVLSKNINSPAISPEQTQKRVDSFLKNLPAAYRDVLTDDGGDVWHVNSKTGRKTSLLVSDRIQIIAHYSQSQNYTLTAKNFNVSPYAVKELVERNPRLLVYFEERAKTEAVTLLDWIMKSSFLILAQRLNKNPEKFSNDELNKLAAMAFDKKRLEEGKPEKIIRFDTTETMQDKLKQIAAELKDSRLKIVGENDAPITR